LLVILNFSKEMPVFVLPADVHVRGKRMLISNYPVDEGADISTVTLRRMKRVSTMSSQNQPLGVEYCHFDATL
jgi:hypothetical protein